MVNLPVDLIIDDVVSSLFFSPWSQCNNPMTKEPKLEAAVRIVVEWTDYDQEIKRLQTRVQEAANQTIKHHRTGISHSRVK